MIEHQAITNTNTCPGDAQARKTTDLDVYLYHLRHPSCPASPMSGNLDANESTRYALCKHHNSVCWFERDTCRLVPPRHATSNGLSAFGGMHNHKSHGQVDTERVSRIRTGLNLEKGRDNL